MNYNRIRHLLIERINRKNSWGKNELIVEIGEALLDASNEEIRELTCKLTDFPEGLEAALGIRDKHSA